MTTGSVVSALPYRATQVDKKRGEVEIEMAGWGIVDREIAEQSGIH